MADASTPVMQAFICDITMEIMSDPVIAPDGKSYERKAITSWLQRQGTSPITYEPMSVSSLVANSALKDAIEQWRSQLPLAIHSSSLSLSEPEVVLGEGSFGRVVFGTLRSYGREQSVAVKMLPIMTRAEKKSQFEREIKAHLAAQQRTDGVCKLLHTCEKAGKICLVMKLYSSSLADKITRVGSVGDSEIQRIGHSLFQTLVQLHEAGVIVNDIKPENILLDQFDDPVFCDFGISDIILRSTRILPTSVKGTFNYMAPEKFDEGNRLGFEVDIWSMACILLEMHTGHPPWEGMSNNSISKTLHLRSQRFLVCSSTFQLLMSGHKLFVPVYGLT